MKQQILCLAGALFLGAVPAMADRDMSRIDLTVEDFADAGADFYSRGLAFCEAALHGSIREFDTSADLTAITAATMTRAQYCDCVSRTLRDQAQENTVAFANARSAENRMRERNMTYGFAFLACRP